MLATHPSSLFGQPPVIKPDYASLQQAANWYAALQATDADEQEHAAWRTWLAERPEHASAWQYVEAVGKRFEPLQGQSSRHPAATTLKAVHAAQKQGLPRRRIFNGMAAAAGASLLGWAAWRTTPLPGMVMAWSSDYSTATGEVREVALADGTRLWLNTASAINADYDITLRRVQLVGGEVLIQTAPDAVRPFVVDTGHGRMRALGTRFSVRRQVDATWLAVYEGAVEIRTATDGVTRIIRAGEQASFTNTGISASAPADRSRQAWTRGVLVAEDISLGELVAELGRYRSGYLHVAPLIAGLRVMGAYPLTDTDRALAMLEDALPVKVRRTLPWWVTLEPRGPGTS